MYITRISALQLAVVGLTGRGGSAARGRDLPAGRALVQEGRASADELHRGGAEIDARLAGDRAARKIETQNRLGTRRALLLLGGAGRRRAQLLASGRSVVALERGAQALRHRCRVALSIAGATASGSRAGKRAHGCDRDCAWHVGGCTPARGRLPLTSVNRSA
jgi:hypothetical protein